MNEQARTLIAEYLDVGIEAAHDAATFRDLGADSLDLIALPRALEEAFDVYIPDEFVETCTTVADAILLLGRCVEAGVLARNQALADV